jgi:hypothetical protein
MERREHYDPEDLEQLLMERSYDELLEEERAYVLRHLSGREEYEAMRRLLHHVQRSEPEAELLDAEPQVKAHVMQLFRDQRKPQWRVWLNSVGAVLLPEEASAMWRPALALAGLALLISTGVWLFRSTDGPTTELAEVRKETPEPPTPSSPLAPDASEPSVPSSTINRPITSSASDEVDQPAPSLAESDLQAAEEVTPDKDDAMSKDMVAVKAVPAKDEERVAQEDVATNDLDDRRSADPMVKFDVSPAATNSGYTDNWSLANTQGTVARETAVAQEKKQARSKGKCNADDHSMSRDLSKDRSALALLSAAW